MKMRHEYKHRLNFGDYAILAPRLAAVMTRDKHAGANGKYRVRSLYFDTYEDKALKEKLDGVDRREKFRIRCYPGSTSQIILLEKKSKIKGLCNKVSEKITEDECKKIIKGDIDAFKTDERPLLVELWHKMRAGLAPKAIIEYEREAFVFPAGNVRVTFDSNIKTSLKPSDFLDEASPLVPAGDEPLILEVKYDGFLPAFIGCILQVGSRRAAACSKYALGRIYG